MGGAFNELRDETGTWKQAESKVYDLAEIIAYLQDCTEEPQNDTKVYFTIRETGDLYISTYNDDLPGEIEGSGFPLAKGE